MILSLISKINAQEIKSQLGIQVCQTPGRTWAIIPLGTFAGWDFRRQATVTDIWVCVEHKLTGWGLAKGREAVDKHGKDHCVERQWEMPCPVRGQEILRVLAHRFRQTLHIHMSVE